MWKYLKDVKLLCLVMILMVLRHLWCQDQVLLIRCCIRGLREEMGREEKGKGSEMKRKRRGNKRREGEIKEEKRKGRKLGIERQWMWILIFLSPSWKTIKKLQLLWMLLLILTLHLCYDLIREKELHFCMNVWWEWGVSLEMVLY